MAIAFEGVVSGRAVNGGTITLVIPASAAVIGNCAVVSVMFGTSRTPTLSVVSSTGISYTQITATTTSSYARVGTFRRIFASTGEVTLTIAGNAIATDGLTGIAEVFSGVDTTTPEDVTAVSTIGTGTTPTSASITVVSCGCAIISAFGARVVDVSVTAPTSFLDARSTASNETNGASAGFAWITNSSTSAYAPTSWTGLTSASWVATTVALRPIAAETFTWQDLSGFAQVTNFRGFDVVGY